MRNAKPPEDRWTYRYIRNGRTSERHFDSEQEALVCAINDIEGGRSLPVAIRFGRSNVYEIEELVTLWAERFL